MLSGKLSEPCPEVNQRGRRAGPQEERNRAFTPIRYSSNDFSVTIGGWQVRSESGRTLKKNTDIKQEGSESNEGTGSRRRRVLWLADLFAPFRRRPRGRHRGQLRQADHRPRAQRREPDPHLGDKGPDRGLARGELSDHRVRVRRPA